ncbi:hypothetical protein OIU78_023373 [Salix suchowensis]|nr:hypothetical protein OIU78_023373 [Salix suchowensis]
MATRNSVFANPKPCEHLADYKLRHGLSGYKSIQKWLKANPYGNTSIKMLSCSDHTLLHTQSEYGHDIAVDIERSELYCCLCSDQIKQEEEVEFSGGFGFEKVQTFGFDEGSKGEIVLSIGIERTEQFGEYLFHELCAVYSGNRTPYSPAQFLYSWWHHSANLASYEQQDAHEFFISVLDGIHEREGKERNSNKDNGGCQCIAHRVFSGMLRSDVTCTACGFTSTTYDPCVDISLNMDTTNFSSVDVASKSVRPNEDTGRSTLLACLDLFTRPERLGSDQKLYCQNCQERRDSMKQMSIKRLPLVLSLHIKRFEHSSLRRSSRKIDWFLQFPFSLDMTPYLSPSIVRNRFGNRIFGFESDESDISSEFEVFAVVTHSGMLDSGHYVTYLRLQDQWYKCDDAWITEVDERIVRAAQCYMIFYVQKMLYCKANED